MASRIQAKAKIRAALAKKGETDVLLLQIFKDAKGWHFRRGDVTKDLGKNIRKIV